MHSSDVLRSEQFHVEVDGLAVSHGAYFARVTRQTRLGVVAPSGIDGAGAAAMVLAYVTAFYNDYRAVGGDFFVYPDYFVFVPEDDPRPSYGMLDVWPDHKVVGVGREPLDVLRAVTDRAVNVLLVPDGEPKDNAFDRVALGAADRTIEACYAYAFDGQVRDADVTVQCPANPVVDWVKQMFDSAGRDATIETRKRQWLEGVANNARLSQQYRRITLADALARL